MRELHLAAPPDFPDVQPGADLGRLICECLAAHGLAPAGGDLLVVAHKVVSKAEGAVVHLGTVRPGPAARDLAATTGKDPRLCQVVLDESRSVVRQRPGLVVTEHRLGWICANAAIDASNAPGGGQVVLLPRDPDASARRVRAQVEARFSCRVGVIVTDTHGRAHRDGLVGVCIGLSGTAALRSWVGRQDRRGVELRSSVEAVADEVAAAATLLQGQADDGCPLVLVRGVPPSIADEGAGALRRPAERDLFR